MRNGMINFKAVFGGLIAAVLGQKPPEKKRVRDVPIHGRMKKNRKILGCNNHGQGTSKVSRKMAVKSNRINRDRMGRRWTH